MLDCFQGFEAAVSAGAKEVAIFASASESFSLTDINSTIQESLLRYRAVATAAKEHSIPVRILRGRVSSGRSGSTLKSSACR